MLYGTILGAVSPETKGLTFSSELQVKKLTTPRAARRPRRMAREGPHVLLCPRNGRPRILSAFSPARGPTAPPWDR